MENWDDQLSRLKLMADNDMGWDLSDNDKAAITSALARLAAVQAERDNWKAATKRLEDAALKAGCTVDSFALYEGCIVSPNVRELRAERNTAQAGEARAVEALERVVVELREEANKFSAMANNHFTHGEAYGWREACRRVVGIIGDKNISALDWLDQREREAAAVELERLAGGSLLALGIAAVRDWLRDRAAVLRAGKGGE